MRPTIDKRAAASACSHGAVTCPGGETDARSAAIGRLIVDVQAVSSDAIQNALLAKVEAARDLVAKRNLTGACGPIDAFISQVQAQSGKKLTLAQANGLLVQADEIRALLLCR